MRVRREGAAVRGRCGGRRRARGDQHAAHTAAAAGEAARDGAADGDAHALARVPQAARGGGEVGGASGVAAVCCSWSLYDPCQSWNPCGFSRHVRAPTHWKGVDHVFSNSFTVWWDGTQAYDTNTEAAEALRTQLCKRDASQPALPFTMSGADYLAGIVPRSGVRACARPAPSPLKLPYSCCCRLAVWLIFSSACTCATVPGTKGRESATVSRPQNSDPYRSEWSD
jgi:hypothetical protein